MTQARPTPVDWGARLEGLIDGALRYWWLIPTAIIVAGAALSFGRITDWLDGPSGREVIAEVNQRTSEANQRTSEAETERARETVVIIEHGHRARARINTQVEQAREAIAQAPDLRARYAEYRERAQRLRDEGRAAVAASVQRHTADDAP